MDSIERLMSGVVDYAGLFPPAALDLKQTVTNYAEYLKRDEGRYLGRLVLPVSRIREFEDAAEGLLPRGNPVFPWYLSAVIDEDLIASLEEIVDFNLFHARNEQAGAAIIDTLEVKANSVGEIQRSMFLVPRTLNTYFEIPVDSDPVELILTISNARARAKVRTGGPTPEAIPSDAALARFIVLCAESRLQFKATAGLHHAITGEYPLTSDSEGPRSRMYGFVNLIVATSFARFEMEEKLVREVLAETSASAFAFDNDGLQWRSHRLTNRQLELTRSQIAIAFGSCSFEEPVNELAQFQTA